MSFILELARGLHGVRFALPASAEVFAEHPRGVSFHDRAHQVNWHISHTLGMLDLRPTYDKILQSDLTACARAAFLAHSATEASQLGLAIAGAPADPDWSPVVGAAYIELGTEHALYIVRRLTQLRGCEIVAGQVLLPIARGTFAFSAYSRGASTGMREAVLMDRLLAARGGETSAAFVRDIEPGTFDDTAYDSIFPDHPLSCVRAACDWLIDPQGARIEVKTPMPPVPVGEIVLPQLGCAITPPPRYLYAPALTSAMNQNLAVFTREVLPHDSLLNYARHLDVYRVPSVRYQGRDSHRQLEKLARQQIQAWALEGALDIRLEIEQRSNHKGQLQVAGYVRYRNAAGPTHAAACWLIDHDGTVFRVLVGGPLFLSRPAFERDVEAVVNSWRRC
jgi:hypothetical protein